jgi:hypothetical protein
MMKNAVSFHCSRMMQIRCYLVMNLEDAGVLNYPLSKVFVIELKFWCA